MPDKVNPIELPEVVITAKRMNPKKYREVKEKVKLYPFGEIDKYKIDSMSAKGLGKVIGEPIKQKGQPDMYGPEQSDRIKQLLRR